MVDIYIRIKVNDVFLRDHEDHDLVEKISFNNQTTSEEELKTLIRLVIVLRAKLSPSEISAIVLRSSNGALKLINKENLTANDIDTPYEIEVAADQDFNPKPKRQRLSLSQAKMVRVSTDLGSSYQPFLITPDCNTLNLLKLKVEENRDDFYVERITLNDLKTKLVENNANDEEVFLQLTSCTQDVYLVMMNAEQLEAFAGPSDPIFLNQSLIKINSNNNVASTESPDADANPLLLNEDGFAEPLFKELAHTDASNGVSRPIMNNLDSTSISTIFTQADFTRKLKEKLIKEFGEFNYLHHSISDLTHSHPLVVEQIKKDLLAYLPKNTAFEVAWRLGNRNLRSDRYLKKN